MPDAKSPAAFRDVEEILLRALEAENGCRIRCSSQSEAVRLRRRIYSFREMDRKAKAKLGQQSDYDSIEVAFRWPEGNAQYEEGFWGWVELTKTAPERYQIETF